MELPERACLREPEALTPPRPSVGLALRLAHRQARWQSRRLRGAASHARGAMLFRQWVEGMAFHALSQKSQIPVLTTPEIASLSAPEPALSPKGRLRRASRVLALGFQQVGRYHAMLRQTQSYLEAGICTPPQVSLRRVLRCARTAHRMLSQIKRAMHLLERPLDGLTGREKMLYSRMLRLQQERLQGLEEKARQLSLLIQSQRMQLAPASAVPSAPPLNRLPATKAAAIPYRGPTFDFVMPAGSWVRPTWLLWRRAAQRLIQTLIRLQRATRAWLMYPLVDTRGPSSQTS